jgi:hypothetical protein
MHTSLGQLVDSPESLPPWNVTLIVTRAFFNFGELIQLFLFAITLNLF